MPSATCLQVLGTLVELQHLLSHSKRYQPTDSRPFSTSGSRHNSKQPSRKSSWGRNRPSFRHLCRDNSISSESENAGQHIKAATAAAACATVSLADDSTDSTINSGCASGTSSYCTSLLSAQGVQQHRLNMQQPASATTQNQSNLGVGTQQPGQAQLRCSTPEPQPLHVVACVTNTASKAVAAAFFGAMGPDAAASAAAHGRLDHVSGSVVGVCEFSYELIVPGEVESAVLVQVAGEPLYTQVGLLSVHARLGESKRVCTLT
jgi:hypothetical protein